MTIPLRWLVVLAGVATAGFGVWRLAGVADAAGWNPFNVLQLALTGICVAWLAWGAAIGLVGLFRPRRPAIALMEPPSEAWLAVLVPVYNEDPQATFARVAAISRGLTALGRHDRCHFFILSDTTSVEIASREVVWFERLLGESETRDKTFYRRRAQNTARKAGNIEDFIRRSGRAYDYALVLDADSLMEPSTIVEMVRRMDSEPQLGLLQSVPVIIRARSLFGRAAQFATSFYSPAYASGTAALQGTEGPYWGHNAIFRIRAFAASCGLPELAGSPPFGGHILSHDYVEAALLARAGWHVRLDPDLEGSYEEAPENLLDFAKRDKRWCQGNLQHYRVLRAPRLRIWNRITLLHGILAYVQAPIWLALICLSVVDVVSPARANANERWVDWQLLALIAGLLLLPKVFIAAQSGLTGKSRRFGGRLRVASAVLAEIVFSSLIAPVILLMQTRAVAQTILGFDGGWPASNRADGRVTLRHAWMSTYWITVCGAVIVAAVMIVAPALVLWSMITVVPLLSAPALIALSSRPLGAGAWLWPVAREPSASPVVREWERIHARWGGGAEATDGGYEEPAVLAASADAPR